MLKCLFCTKVLKTKATYLRHLNTIHLKKYQSEQEKLKILEEITNLNEKNLVKNETCQHCHKCFANYYTLERHQQKVCSLNQEDRDYNLIIERLKNIKDPSKLNEIRQVINNITIHDVNDSDIHINSHNNSHNTNNIKVDINLVNLGRETRKPLQNDDLVTRIYQMLIDDDVLIDNGTYRGGYVFQDKSVFHEVMSQVFEKIHCNSKYPENHNIYVTNKKTNVPFQVYKDGTWQLGTFEDLGKALYHDCQNLMGLIDEVIEDNPDHQRELLKIRSGLENKLNFKNISNDQKLKKQIFNKSYQNKEIVRETYLKTKDQIRKILNEGSNSLNNNIKL